MTEDEIKAFAASTHFAYSEIKEVHELLPEHKRNIQTIKSVLEACQPFNNVGFKYIIEQFYSK